MSASFLFLIDYFHRTGGTETHLAHLVRHLCGRGAECTVVAFDMGANPLLDEMKAAGASVIHLPVAREYTPHALVQAIRLMRLIRSRRFDIVQTFHQKADSYGALVARIAGSLHIVSSKRDTGHLRGSRHFFLNRRLRFLFEKVIVVADAVGEAVTRSDGHDPRRLVRIYNGVDTSRFLPVSEEQRGVAKTRLGFNESDFVVGMVAGFRPEKGHRIFFEGALAALKEAPSLKLLAVGGGPLLDAFRTRYASTGLPVVFAGDVADVRSVIAAMDVGCLLPTSNEGFSNSIIENMAMGLPLIVSRVGGNAEAVIHGVNGLVVQPNDAGAFADAVKALYSLPAERHEMGLRSRALAVEKFSLERMFELHEKLYNELIPNDHRT